MYLYPVLGYRGLAFALMCKTVVEIVYQNKCVCHPVTLIIAKDLTEKCFCLLWTEYVQVVVQKISGLSKLYYIYGHMIQKHDQLIYYLEVAGINYVIWSLSSAIYSIII